MTSDAEREAGRRFSEMLRERLEAGRIKIEDLMGQENDQDERRDDGETGDGGAD